MAAIPFLNLFRELAPFFAKQRRISDLPVVREDGLINPADDARSRIREISPWDLARFKDLPFILDVREEEEFFSGHIKGAQNVRVDFLQESLSAIVPDRSSPILVYCAAGNRGALAADSLQKIGYLNVFSLKGGLSGWLEAGGWVERA